MVQISKEDGKIKCKRPFC